LNRWKVAALVFGSGFAALALQTAWLRELRLVFGVSTAASAAVVAVFMAGLGLGGVILGRRADQAARPLALYARLELGVAAAAATTPFLVVAARGVYTGVGGTAALGDLAGTLVRLVSTAAVLGVPTFLMGGTLPAAARAVETAGDLSRRHLALVYGANTVGAVAGALASTFFLLELVGNRRTLWLACLVLVLVAVAARALARGTAPAEAVAAPAVEPAAEPTAGIRFVLPAAAVVGFAFFLLELVWYRMLSPLLGGSTFTFGLVLAVALAGIGAGGVAYGLLFANRRVTLGDLAWTATWEALLVAAPLALGDRLAILALLLRELGAAGFAGHLVGWALITAIVVFPVAFVAGVQFPLLVGLLGAGERDVGRQLGLAYLWNTAGAVAGALAGGFGLLAWLSAPTSWRLVVGVLAALAVAALVADRRRAGARRSFAAAGAALAALGALAAEGPTAVWRHSGIGAGRYPPYRETPNGLRAWSNNFRRTLVWEAEGVESSVATIATSGIAFLVNGKSDGHARRDAGTQVMAGLVGALLHRRPERALVVGLGTGSSAGWLAAVDSISRVDVVELEPAIVEVARECAAVNHQVLADPEVRLHFADAREWMLTARERYDLVFSEPSNPYRAGIASLFTVEFYRSARERLRPGGLFLQWLQAYEVDAETVATVYATLGTVFPEVETWRTTGGDLLLVASATAIDHDAARLRRRMAEEPFRAALAAVWRVSDLEGLLPRFVADSRWMRALRDARHAPLNTDDRTPIEFGFARAVDRRGLPTLAELAAEAARLGAARPPFDAAEIDWAALEERTASADALDEVRRPLPAGLAGDARWRAESVAAWARGDLRAAWEAWTRQSGPPTDDTQRLAAAEAAAEAGDDAATAWAAELAAARPVEAGAVLARWHARHRRWPQAAAELAGALERYRSDPWPYPALVERALELLREVAEEARDEAVTRRLATALLEPFAVRMHEETRRLVRLDLARLLPGAPCNEAMRAALAELEPHVPWSGPLLALRAACYGAWGAPERARAERELARFRAAEPRAFDPGATPAATAAEGAAHPEARPAP
jgi:spermidine synthase